MCCPRGTLDSYPGDRGVRGSGKVWGTGCWMKVWGIYLPQIFVENRRTITNAGEALDAVVDTDDTIIACLETK